MVGESERRRLRELELASGRRRWSLKKWEKGDSDEAETRERKQKGLDRNRERDVEGEQQRSRLTDRWSVERGKRTREERERWATVA